MAALAQGAVMVRTSALVILLPTLVMQLPRVVGQDAATKKPVPDPANQQKAEKVIKDLYKESYAKRGPASRVALANTLLQRASDLQEDRVTRFVLLREAREIATEAGDSATALRAVDRLASEFDIENVLVMKAVALENAVRVPTTLAFHRATVNGAHAVWEEAVDVDDYATASRIMKVAEAAARKTASQVLLAAMLTRMRETEDLQLEFQRTEAARQTLQKKPSDPEASGTVGGYLCFVKGDWNKGWSLRRTRS